MATIASHWSGMELQFLADGGVDLERLRSHFNDRLQATEVGGAPDMPLDEELQSIMDQATRHAAAMREDVRPHVMFFLALSFESVARIIRDFGGNVAAVRDAFRKVFENGLP